MVSERGKQRLYSSFSLVHLSEPSCSREAEQLYFFSGLFKCACKLSYINSIHSLIISFNLHLYTDMWVYIIFTFYQILLIKICSFKICISARRNYFCWGNTALIKKWASIIINYNNCVKYTRKETRNRVVWFTIAVMLFGTFSA